MPNLRTYSAALLLAGAVLVNGAAAEELLQKRCRVCPLDLPQCPPCHQGSYCKTTPQDCDTCATVNCVAIGAGSGNSGQGGNYGTAGAGTLPGPAAAASTFSMAPLPPGVTPASVWSGGQTTSCTEESGHHSETPHSSPSATSSVSSAAAVTTSASTSATTSAAASASPKPSQGGAVMGTEHAMDVVAMAAAVMGFALL